MTTYEALDQACNTLKSTCTQFQQTMQDIRQMIADETQWIRNEILANELLKEAGYLPEDLRKLNQWGILDAPDEDKVREIIREVIEHRRDSIHHSI